MKKLSESQTIIYLADREFILNEMAIGKAKNFAIEIVKSVDQLSLETGKDITEMEVGTMLTLYGDIVFKEIARLFNWVFSYKNTEYKNVTPIWLSNNVTIRMLMGIVKEIARQNQMTWLIPFFQEKIQVALQAVTL